jgi:transcriptional regulator with XRE-family HTH domain
LSGVYRARQEFGGRLRRLREDAGFNGKQFAAHLGWAASKVSRIEHGKQSATSEDVTAWAAAVGAASDLVEDLLAELRNVRFEYIAWSRQLRAGYTPRQRASVGIEGAATTIRAFEADVIPGLLQTADYARHLLARLVAFRELPDDVDRGVRSRMRRQEILYDPGKDLRFLLTEAALRYQPCPAATLRGQLDRLLAVTGLDTVKLAVVPFSTELPVVPTHGFWVFDDDLVLVETLSAELSLRDAEDIDLYTRYFDLVWDIALRDKDARLFIARLAHELVEATATAENTNA